MFAGSVASGRRAHAPAQQGGIGYQLELDRRPTSPKNAARDGACARCVTRLQAAAMARRRRPLPP